MTGSGTEIAVIGLAARVPGASDLDTLWRNLRAGVDSISRFGPDELEPSPLLPDGAREHPDFVPAGGVLAGAESFDHDFFGMSPREAGWLDPQQRVFLQCAWAALEDAGYDPARLADRVSVYAGAGSSGHLLGLLGQVAGQPAALYQALSSGTGENLATRVSFQLGLRGESVTVHTACSTGLAAVHLACQSLLTGQSAMALAGAVRVALPQCTGYLYQDGMILSRDGHCRAFDHRASGTVAGNGVGVVVLKPLPEALADRDHVYAVIAGSALNNDGRRGVGYTAPSIAGQAEVIAEALAFAGATGGDIDYVEAHGTGTPLGDPIEIAALTRAFRRTTDRVADCPIGSVKTNLGHLDTAAGIVGLIKVVLMLQHGEIPPSLHLERPNPAIDFAASPFVVNTGLRPWPRAGGRTRRAGVSSFGIGGTNVHAVVAEPPEPAGESSPSPRPYQLVTLAAGSPAALSRMATELADQVAGGAGRSGAGGAGEDGGDPELADLAYTRAVGRAQLPYRRCHPVRTRVELVTALRRPVPDPPAVTGEPRVGFLFPGQGAAQYGMAAALEAAEPDFRAALDGCLSTLEPLLGRPLRPVLCEGTGPINDPELAHPALFAVEYALARLWLGWGVRPAALFGHSFGEYAAACVAGVLPLPDAAALAVTRGRLVARLPEGRMLAVGVGEPELARWLADAPELSLAAVNGDRRCAVAGPVEAITGLQARLTAANLPAVLLPVRHAFHSPAVEPVLPELAAAAAGGGRPGRPELPLLSSVTGEPWPDRVDGDYWSRQMREPVQFAAALRWLAEVSGPDQPLVLLEVGPDQALTALARDQLGGELTAVPSLASRRGATGDHRVLLTGVGRLWRAGVPIDWPAFYRSERRRRVPLPGYPFEPTRIDPGPLAAAPPDPAQPAPPVPAQPAPPVSKPGAATGGAGLDGGPRDDVERRVFEAWRERLGTDQFGVHDNFLELGGNSLIAAQLLTRLRELFGVPLPLAALFEAPTVAGTADRIRELTGAGAGSPAGDPAARPAPASPAGRAAGAALPPIRPTPRDRPVPLSVVQERTLALAAADPENPALAMPVAVAIDGALDVSILEQAVQAVLARHETLRTTFQVGAAGGWSARIGPAPQLSIEPEPVSGGEPAAQRIARAEPARPFDLAGSPVRARLLRLAPDRHILLLTVHHVVSDTLSLVLLVREITACYQAFQAGEPSPLPPLAIQYADFAGWQRQLLASPALAGQRHYWQERLAGVPAQPLPLPADHPRPPGGGVRGRHQDIGLPAGLSREVVEFSRRLGVTPFVTLLAAYAALLGRVTGADDLVIGTPIGNRDRPELEPLIGYVAHALPLRADLRGDPRFVTLVDQLRQTLLAAYAHPDLPYEHLAARPGTARLFDAVLVLHADLPAEQRLPGATWRLWRVAEAPAMFGATLAAVTLMLAESPDGYTGTLGYADELFEPATANRLFDQFQTLLAGALRRPETRISGLALAESPAPPAPAAQPAAGDPGERRLQLADPGLPPWSPPARRRQRALRLSLSYFANDEDELAGAGSADGPTPAERGKYRLLLAGARLADRSGLAAVWTPERHFHSFGGLYPSPTATNAALAAATTRIGIRAGSVVLPLHDPIRVAEDWSVIDNLSGGRVGVSFASGWHPDDFVLAPDQFPDRRDLLRTGIETVRALWRGAPVRRRNGVGQEVEVRIRPRPVQAELPFWLTAAGSPHTFALAGELGAGVLTNLMAQSLADLSDKIQIYRDAWRAARHPGTGQVTLMLHAFLADDPDRAYQTARGPLLRYFRSSVDVARGFAVAQGLAVRPEDLSEADLQALLEHGLDRYLHHGGLFGTPQTCLEVLDQVRAAGVDEVAALVDYGTSVPDTLHSIRLLGELAGQEAARARAAAATTATTTTAQLRELAGAVAARPGDPVSGPGHLLAWLAEQAPDRLAGRTVLVTDLDPPDDLLCSLAAVTGRVFVPGPELPDGSLPARWAQWSGGAALTITPDPGAGVVDAAGNPLGVGVVGELTRSGTGTGQPARWRADGRIDLLPGPAPRPAPVPLSYAQQRIWSLEQLAPGNIAYNNAMALRLRGPLDAGALHRAVQEVVCRHEVLRTTYHATEDGVTQLVHPSIEIELPVQPAGPDDVAGLARAHAREPFALDRGPLLRARLLRLAPTEHVLLISMHHIVSDGWSAGVLVTELGGLYQAFARGERPPLPPLPIQYADYAVALRERHDSGALATELDYWRRALAGVPPLELPIDRPRPPVQGQQGARTPVHIDQSGAGALAGLCRATGATPFMVLYAALATLLHRHTGQTDLAIGTAVAGRTRPATEALVGVFINTVVIRTDLAGDPTFTELLDRVKAAVLAALAHQEVPFERLVDALQVPRSRSRAPLCQALLVLHNTPAPRRQLDELTLELVEFDPGTAKLDLTVELREGPDGIRGALEYHTDLFEAATVARLARQLVSLLAAATAQPHRRLSELALDPPAEAATGPTTGADTGATTRPDPRG
jgi:natural product biosynthesis luciferase-like monooxygenase protein